MGHVEGDVLDGDVEAGGSLGEVVEAVMAVGHHPDPVLEPVDRPVVDHQAVGIAECAVADLADLEPDDVVGVDPLGRL